MFRVGFNTGFKNLKIAAIQVGASDPLVEDKVTDQCYIEDLNVKNYGAGCMAGGVPDLYLSLTKLDGLLIR